ncbi:cyclic peptide export ABC transporter [Chengkuizengella marina]|uniref:Cyclic peptide export ABC transporter n=1 Tax=Chengkuizengella marina TaxID=2507566 RepID=A0A6N9Q8N8_9BACL|nr:cyclic peptide export ABC transporter [Chengkuizengella marina]NBI31013.1 cyclic peptide export ABC transporter [Chengkuizengella marina]
MQLVFIILLLLITLITLSLCFFNVRTIFQIYKKNRASIGFGKRHWLGILFSMIVIGFIVYCLYTATIYFFNPVPNQMKWILALLFTSICLFTSYMWLTSIYTKPEEKPYISLITLSIISGLGNSMVIFVLNETISDQRILPKNLLFSYFILSILLFLFCQIVIRFKLIKITNDIVFYKRVHFVEKVLKTSYATLESMEDGKIQASLNNDTEIISRFANFFVNVFTWSITIVFGLIYLGLLSFYGLLISLSVVSIASILFYFISKSAEKDWEKTRDIQNHFFKFINDLVGGYKELSLNARKSIEFKEDMTESCNQYRKKRTVADTKLAYGIVTGDLLFVTVIGAVVFLFPILFVNIQNDMLRSYVFVFLYMGGPLTGILNSIPELLMIKVSWNRMNVMLKDLNELETKNVVPIHLPKVNHMKLELKNAFYQYKQQNSDHFKIGPINAEFHSGEIIFITGGNGSGKSTFAKLLVGLYEPDEGGLWLNDQVITSDEVGEYFSVIFSDVYLFDKLYGIDFESKFEEAQKYLKILHLQDKVQITKEGFSTIKLSSGQRKRLALLISYLEDKPFALFDEWAADQDPDYRHFFYTTLLQELKSRGKCIIAITHDDKYFDVADRLFRVDMGKLEELDTVTDPVMMANKGLMI